MCGGEAAASEPKQHIVVNQRQCAEFSFAMNQLVKELVT